MFGSIPVSGKKYQLLHELFSWVRFSAIPTHLSSFFFSTILFSFLFIHPTFYFFLTLKNVIQWGENNVAPFYSEATFFFLSRKKIYIPMCQYRLIYPRNSVYE